LSPNRQESQIEEVDEIISLAPSLAGWEFISCKPRKTEILSWYMLNEKNEKIMVDARNWKCVVYKFPDNTVDLDIKVEEVRGDIDTQYTAVDIHLTNLLGERNYLKIVKQINIVSEFSEKERGRSIPVNDLFKVISTHISTMV
jgi:hypothetical protein